MSRNVHGPILQRRRYTPELQRAFADLAGDHNPMHVDPVAARRTLVGGLAVHGIHHAVASIEALLGWLEKKGTTGKEITGFKAQFLKPVLVGDVVALHLAKHGDDSCLVAGRIDGEIVFRTSIQLGSPSSVAETSLPQVALEPVRELSFAELAGRKGELALGLNLASARQLFPRAIAALGPTRLAATLALSRLVGMECPGLHSIFAEATVRFDAGSTTDKLHYCVTEVEERYNHVAMSVQGVQISGELKAFFRPPPQAQPTLAEVMRQLKPGIFAESTALIIGGSRGLGEVTAKIIAAGGGLPIITYFQGAQDAEKVAAEIRAGGGRCETAQFDVQSGPGAARKLMNKWNGIRSLYYFATPKIFGRRRGFFDHAMLRQFEEIFLSGFGRLVDRAAMNRPTKLRVLYPSSVAVTESIRELAEYAMAKRAGEDLCAFYNQNAKNVEIIVERLPRLKTDQTSTIMAHPVQDTLEVMVPLVSRVEAPLNPAV